MRNVTNVLYMTLCDSFDATHLQGMPHLSKPPVLSGNPLVFRFDGQFMLGSGVVQARSRLWNGIQIDGLDRTSGCKNSSGPGGLKWGAVWFCMLSPLDWLHHKNRGFIQDRNTFDHNIFKEFSTELALPSHYIVKLMMDM